MKLLIIFLIGLSFSEQIPIITVKQLPPNVQEYWYTLPQQTENTRKWALDNYVTLSIPIPNDVIKCYVTWKPYNISTARIMYYENKNIRFKLSWWGEGFSLGIGFEQIF